MGFYQILFVQVTFIGVTLVLSCRNEADCPAGYSCIDNICQTCLKCSKLLRKGKSCVVDFNKCGDCLEGFEEVSITHFSTAMKPCKPIKKEIKLQECLDNSSCPPNNYCLEGSCIMCFNCSLVNRLPPVGKCARGLNECGSCMNGYHVINVTTDTNTKACQANTFVPQETPQKFLHAIVEPFCLGVVGFIIFIMLMHSRDQFVKKSSSQNMPNGMSRPSAPPLNEFVPLIASEDKGTDLCFINCEREKKQQAKVFKKPDALYYWGGEKATNDEARADQISGNNEGIVFRSFDANRSEPEGEILTHRFDGLINDSATDSSPQQPYEIIAGNNDTNSINSIADNIAQVDEDSVNDTCNIVTVIPSTEEGEV